MSSGGCGKPGHVTAGSEGGTQWCATCVVEGEALAPWRVGHKVPINVYHGDRAVCQCHNEEDARLIVAAVNAAIRDEQMFERAKDEPLTDLDALVAVEFDREEDGRWIADIPEAPGCMAYGATKDEAKDAAIAIFKAQKSPH